MNRADIPREAVLEFVTDPSGVFHVSKCDAFMAEWDLGTRWPRGFTALDGFICKIAQDRGLTHAQTEALRDQVFLPRAAM